MRISLIKFSLGIFLAVLFLLVAIWFNLGPSIKPGDITLGGVLKKEQLSPEPKLPTRGGYVVEINLDNTINKPLVISDSEYFSMVYVFVDGFTPFVWDFFKGPNVDVEGFTFGSDSRMIKIVAENLREIGYIVDDSLEGINKLDKSTIGFSYTGEDFPARTRIYLTPLDKKISSSTKGYLVYAHYEKKWGRDLSWAKAEPIKIVE